VDSSFLYALSDRNDKNHTAAREFAANNASIRVVPDITLPEVTHVLKRAVGNHAMLAFLKTFSASDSQLEPIAMEDVRRAADILTQYKDARFDFVDCCAGRAAEHYSNLYL
jgi:predicted nucleic acid-binding protein